jgi:GTP cyclohydrolase I
MSTRGIHKPGVKMLTSSMMGNFEDLEIQKKFLSRIGK